MTFFNYVFFLDFLFLICLLIYPLGLCGFFFFKQTPFSMLICLEVLYLALNLLFLLFSCIFNDIYGNVISLYILLLAGAESIIGLSFLLIFYRLRKSICLDYLKFIKG